MGNKIIPVMAILLLFAGSAAAQATEGSYLPSIDSTVLDNIIKAGTSAAANIMGNVSGAEIGLILTLLTVLLLFLRFNSWGQTVLQMGAVIMAVLILLILTGMINI